ECRRNKPQATAHQRRRNHLVRGRAKVHDAIAEPILAQQYQGLDRGNSQPSRPDVHRKSLRQEIIKRSSNIQLLILFVAYTASDAPAVESVAQGTSRADRN